VVLRTPGRRATSTRERDLSHIHRNERHPPSRKEHEVPCHHNLEEYLDEYIAAAGSAGEPDAPLFQTRRPARPASSPARPCGSKAPTARSSGGRAALASRPRVGNHTFRVTGITAYLKNNGTLEVAQHIANYESPRATKLYDRCQDELSLDEVERIAI
jgi:integrase/recombinase XerD